MSKQGGAFHGDIETTGVTMLQYYAAHAPDFPVQIQGRPDQIVEEIVRLRWLYADLMVKNQSLVSS